MAVEDGQMLSNLGQPQLQATKSDQHIAAFVPERQPPAAEALTKRDDLGQAIELRGGIHARLQPIVGNAAAQVMHMVEADIARKPLEDRRQLEIESYPPIAATWKSQLLLRSQ